MVKNNNNNFEFKWVELNWIKLKDITVVIYENNF